MERKIKCVLRLKSFELLEKRPDGLIDCEVEKLHLSDFNLLMGDNAQGKSRLFRSLFFHKSLCSDILRPTGTQLHSFFEFDVDHTDKLPDKVTYELNMDARTDKRLFSETITLNSEIVFSKKDGILLNEKQNTRIGNIFMPDNVSVLSAITGDEYVTIKLLREFFQRIVFVSSNKQRAIVINPHATVPNEEGTDISYVLLNWKGRYPSLFGEIVADFRKCYPYITNVDLKKIPIEPTGQILDALTLREEKIKFDVEQIQWSDGIYRLLCLLLLPKAPFEMGESVFPPSLILIDEIENGLDFKTLKYIIKYYEEYSDDSQVIMSSHSPLVCDFVSPTKWIIVRRSGTKLRFIAPHDVENDLNSQLDIFKQKHWDFYLKHISNSRLYKVE